jgi:hypothetical protein
MGSPQGLIPRLFGGVSSSLKNSLFAAQHIFPTILTFASLQNQKLAFEAQTLRLRPFRFTKNGYRKNLDSRSQLIFPIVRGLYFPFTA